MKKIRAWTDKSLSKKACLCVEKINFNGDGKLTVLADGKAIAVAEPGTYEIKVTCKVDVVLHSVTIQ